ncbi:MULTISPECIES: hypothetical protein [unclassified Psychrobacter]|uniref:hypothetical protein n=1 Tax=unclassified Psychrobacter TaxID=196806 RepID=UPI003F4842B6
MSEFSDFLTDRDYIGSYNVFLSGNIADKDNGIIYVEDASDWKFWEEFIDYYYPKEYMCRPSSKDGKTVTGKRFLETIYDTANEKVIIAVDSDYDYIASKAQASHVFNHNKYIVHTYGFSRESVQLEKYHLQNFFERCKLTLPNTVNLLEFLEKFSEISFSALARYTVLLKRVNYINIHENGFNSCFNILDNKLIDNDLNVDLSTINKIENSFDLFFSEKNISENDIDEAEYFLKRIGINKGNAYRFISGHVFFVIVKKIHKDSLLQLMKDEIVKVKEDVDKKSIKGMVSHVTHLFKNSFSFDTYCNMRYVDPDDEVHKLILSAIDNIK